MAMKKEYKVLLYALLIVAILVLGIVYLTQIDMVVLNSKGVIGQQQSDLFWLASNLMLIVVIPVFILTFVIVWKYRAGNRKAKYKPDWNHSTLAEIIWWGVPCIIIVILSVVNWIACFDLDPFKPIASDKKPITIQVVALDWKWLFIYPDQKIATVNFIQIPIDTPINFVITADAPMNSFWIPQLGGQIFAMPAMRTELHLTASEMGEYRGVSANLSGKGFSGMVFWTKATSEADFEKWISEVQSSKQALDLDGYKLLAQPSENNPVAYYRLLYPGLFDWVVMKDMMPEMEASHGH